MRGGQHSGGGGQRMNASKASDACRWQGWRQTRYSTWIVLCTPTPNPTTTSTLLYLLPLLPACLQGKVSLSCSCVHCRTDLNPVFPPTTRRFFLSKHGADPDEGGNVAVEGGYHLRPGHHLDSPSSCCGTDLSSTSAAAVQRSRDSGMQYFCWLLACNYSCC